ncbi:MAG: sulfite exporter TauE/SafE family protein [Chloroflexia bacterium]|nr:sulfite exporter TauE/SafE family protein [Chloroflexia bacterium]
MALGLLAAFVAGILSISSPCVLPLIPFYLAHLAGTGAAKPASNRGRILIHALAFVLGFGLIFVLLGVSLGALGGIFLAYRDWIVRVGGIVMVVMGLHLIGLIHLRFLDYSRRLAIPGAGARPGQLSSSFLVGVGFAAGWTPCVGPVLGAIFTLAISAADPVRSGALFAAYAAGLAIPFLGIGMAVGSVAPWLRRAGAGVNVVSGAMLTAIGLLMVLGIYQQVFARIVSIAPWTPWEPRL